MSNLYCDQRSHSADFIFVRRSVEINIDMAAILMTSNLRGDIPLSFATQCSQKGKPT